MQPFDVCWAAPLRRALKVRWPLLLSALLLGACTVGTVQPGTALTTGPNEGIAVFSITRSGDRDFDWWPELRGPGGGAARALVLYSDRRTQDWPGSQNLYHTAADDPVGRLIVLRLAPGTYHISRWRGDAKEGGLWGIGFHVEGVGLGLSFTVRPGMVTYFGNVNFVFPKQLNYLANISDAPYQVQVSPRPQRDLALLHRKYGVAEQDVHTDLMRSQPHGPLRYYVYNIEDGSNDRQ